MEINSENIKKIVVNAVENGMSARQMAELSIAFDRADEQSQYDFHEALTTKFEEISKDLDVLLLEEVDAG